MSGIWRASSGKAPFVVAMFFLSGPAVLAEDMNTNLITNVYAPSWRPFPFGHGEYLNGDGDLKSGMLSLTAVRPGAMVSIPDLPFKPNQAYELVCRAKAAVGVPYRFYVSCKEQYGSGSAIGNGEWQTTKVSFSFKDFPKGRKREMGFGVVTLDAAGDLLVSEFSVIETEDKSARLRKELEAGGASLTKKIYDSLWVYSGQTEATGTQRQIGESDQISLDIQNNSDEGALWVFPDIPFESGNEYLVSFSVDADPGMNYRVYVENNTDGNWQNFSDGVHQGAGTATSHDFPVKFDPFQGKCYLVVQAMSPGKISVSEVKVASGNNTSN